MHPRHVKSSQTSYLQSMATREKEAKLGSELSTPYRRLKPSRVSTMKRGATRRSWKRRIRYVYLRFVRLRGSSKEIARGLAAGVFAGLFPLFGFQIIIGIAIAALLKGNKIIAAAGTWISNPFTYVPIYAFNYQVGRWLLGPSQTNYTFSDLQSVKAIMAMGANITLTLFVGCFVTGLVGSIGSYFLGLQLINFVRRQRRKLRCRLAGNHKNTGNHKNAGHKKWDR